MLTEPFPWCDPLSAAQRAAGRYESLMLLYSGQQHAHTGRFSYLCLEPQETLAAVAFAPLAAKLTASEPALANAWFGYLGYEMLHDTETLPKQPTRSAHTPASWFTRFGVILRFDHHTHTVECTREPHLAPPEGLHTLPAVSDAPPPAIASLGSPMARDAYLAAVQATTEAIHRGDFYQANITRKFTGTFRTAPDRFALFARLCKASPAAYSSYIQTPDFAVLSSSPERFLTITAGGMIDTRPIKGTAPRLADAHADAQQKATLATSEKDRAENLMIVDLMRNDLARSCAAGSVKVTSLFDVSTYATLHHMASTITGQKRADVTTLDAVKLCFPPGSMTGAPKVSAMQWCLAHEPVQRGIYSGALGWFGGDGSCDLSVVIRTLVIEGNRFEFQVGGGIVADSDPEKEWRETLTKARGIMAALGMDVKTLEDI